MLPASAAKYIGTDKPKTWSRTSDHDCCATTPLDRYLRTDLPNFTGMRDEVDKELFMLIALHPDLRETAIDAIKNKLKERYERIRTTEKVDGNDGP
jgi:hypothetical protein